MVDVEVGRPIFDYTMPTVVGLGAAKRAAGLLKGC